MALKRSPEATVALHYPELQMDDFLGWLVKQPTYDLIQAKYIKLWYKYNFENKQQRYTTWMNEYRMGNSEEKMKILLGENTEEFKEWRYNLRSKRKSCLEYWTKIYGGEIGSLKYREHQQSVNHTNVEKRVDGWRQAFSEKTEEEMQRINADKAITRETTIQRYGEVEGEKRWKEICAGRSHSTVEYFMSKGEDEENAIRLNEEFKRKQSLNTPYNLEYWNNKYPNDPERALLSHVEQCQSREHFTLENCIKKHGEMEGRNIWQKRQDAWMESFYNRSDEEMVDIIRRRTSGGISKSSQLFFDRLMNVFPDLSYQTGTKGGEICLKVHLKKWYMYDFYCPELNLIIEYHGRYYHSDEETIENDKLKKAFAEERGYNFIYVYDDQPDAYEYCINKIKELLNEQN